MRLRADIRRFSTRVCKFNIVNNHIDKIISDPNQAGFGTWYLILDYFFRSHTRTCILGIQNTYQENVQGYKCLVHLQLSPSITKSQKLTFQQCSLTLVTLEKISLTSQQFCQQKTGKPENNFSCHFLLCLVLD